MYQLMSAAVHVLRYVLSSGYQMRALHEFTNVSGSSADLDASDRNYSVLYRSIFSNYVLKYRMVAKLGVLYWYSKKEGHGCCNGPNVKVECAIHI